MREDLFEVLIERPRTRSWRKRRSQWHRLAEAERPRCEVMSEVHARISSGSYLQRHLLEHLERMAAPDAEGRLRLTGRWG